MFYEILTVMESSHAAHATRHAQALPRPCPSLAPGIRHLAARRRWPSLEGRLLLVRHDLERLLVRLDAQRTRRQEAYLGERRERALTVLLRHGILPERQRTLGREREESSRQRGAGENLALVMEARVDDE
jgi:hypothetical protein